MNLVQLYRLSWGIKTRDPEEYKRLIETRFEPLRLKMQEEILASKSFEPRIVYGFFPAHSMGNDLLVYDEEGAVRERFKFPRQKVGKHLCLSDYLRPASSQEKDVVAFQVVTVGDKASRVAEALSNEGKFTESYYLYGLAVQTAEALAEWMHRRIRKEWGLPENQGKRYSPGYPACPDHSDQAKLFRLLNVEKNIGVTLTKAFMMVPEQSTSAMVLHHPDCEYFAVR